ncbi:MAG TPA: nuclear transport factor 2 family protein [Thermoanaerobaculia bacterium]|nr:nuclear transport factor 2 family protein [Thermoanaerobaculia bacterium]
MPRIGIFILLAATLNLAGACASTTAMDEGAMIAAARALDREFVAAFNSGDAEALSRLHWNSPDAVLFPPGALEARGIDAIRRANAAALASIPGATIELFESHQIPAGDLVIGWGKWRLTIPGPDGETTEIIGRHTDVKAMRDGRWVYLLDHASVPLPPPE